jgi:hypothetical protein
MVDLAFSRTNPLKNGIILFSSQLTKPEKAMFFKCKKEEEWPFVSFHHSTWFTVSSWREVDVHRREFQLDVSSQVRWVLRLDCVVAQD